MMNLEDLAKVCKFAGRQVPGWTQANGGNISVKYGNRMAIKASGLRLDSVTATHGIAELDLAKLVRLLGQGGASMTDELTYASALQDCSSSTCMRPSMETAMHAILPSKWVTHLHPPTALLMASDPHLDKALGDLAEDLTVVPYATPGVDLARAVAPFSDIRILLLANHGVVLQDNELPSRPLGCLENWERLEKRYCEVRHLRLMESVLNRSVPSLFELSKSLGPGPLRIYFPDMAVFSDSLYDVLVSDPSSPTLFHLDPRAWATSKNLCELWLVIQLLFRSSPGLQELSLEEANRVRMLGFESYRRHKAV